MITAKRRAYLQRYGADRYRRLSEAKACTKCGVALPARSPFKACFACRKTTSLKRPVRANTLTARQEEVLRLVYMGTLRRGSSPSCRELATAMGFRSSTAITDHLRFAEKKGYARRPGRSIAGATIITALPLFVPGPDGLAVLGGFVAPRRDP